MKKIRYPQLHLYGCTGSDPAGSANFGNTHNYHPDIFYSTSSTVPEESGWLLHCDKYTIDWESTEVQQIVRQHIEILTKGCNFKQAPASTRSGTNKFIHLYSRIDSFTNSPSS